MESGEQSSGGQQDRGRPGGSLRRGIWAVAACGLLLLFLVDPGDWFNSAHSPETALIAAQGSIPTAEPTDGYVGSQRCRSCHQHEHATWHDTYHRTMTQLASPTSIVGDFDGVELTSHNRSYFVERDAENAWIEGPSPDGDGTIRRKVELCTGSHHVQAYWTSTGRGSELELFPFVWLIAEQKWIPRESSFVTPPSHEAMIEKGRWNKLCIVCHATHGQRYREPAEVEETMVSEFGISCEACHGPGEAHVLRHTNPEASDAADLIVNPQHLSHERAADVCARCHMAWTFEEPDSLLTFRPGDNLQRLRRVEKTLSVFWRDGMVRVVGDEFNGLSESPCFQRGTMSCLSCHTMHQAEDDSRSRDEWTDDLLKPLMRTNEACLSCHEEFRHQDTLQAHTHHLPASDGSLCYNCHMPHTSYGLLKASRCHQISSPSVAEFLHGVGRPNACNLCHLDKSLAWTDTFLNDWYGHESEPLSGNGPEVALSIEVALQGDASQRALIAWHLGWEPAREASGDDWMAPYLGILMQDDYPAVRFIADRSIRRLDGFDDISYDSEMPPIERAAAVRGIMDRWRSKRPAASRPSLLIGPDGSLQQQRVDQRLRQRNHARIFLDE